MTTTTLIKDNAGGEYEWLHVSDSMQQLANGDVEQLVESDAANADLVFIAPAELTFFRQVPYSSSERSIYRKTIPYSLEDELVDAVEQMHFAFATPVDQQVLVAAIQRQLFDHYLDDFEQHKAELQQFVPELALLPHHADAWTLLVDGDRWLMKTSDHEGAAIEAETAPLALQLLLDQADVPPQQLHLYTSESQQQQVVARLPSLLKDCVVWHDQDYWHVIGDQYQDAEPLNLLQGDYARGLPWHKWWKQWQLPLILLAVTVVAQLGLNYLNVYFLEQKNVQLRSEIEQVYREVVPKGAVVDAEKQLRRKLAQLEGGSSEGFISLLDKMARIVAGVDGISIKSLNYNDRQSEIRLTILAPSFKDVETIRSQLENQGFVAKLTGSSDEGGKTRAGLRITKS